MYCKSLIFVECNFPTYSSSFIWRIWNLREFSTHLLTYSCDQPCKNLKLHETVCDSRPLKCGPRKFKWFYNMNSCKLKIKNNAMLYLHCSALWRNLNLESLKLIDMQQGTVRLLKHLCPIQFVWFSVLFIITVLLCNITVIVYQ